MICTDDVLSDVRRRLPAARDAILCAVGDIPASGGSGGGSGVSDRTGRLACMVLEGVDQAYRDLDELTTIEWFNRRHGGVTKHQLMRLQALCDRWAPDPRRKAALDANLRAAADDLLNRHDDQGNCTSCKRVPGAWGEPFRRGLCVNCYRYLERVHALYDVVLELPPKRLVEVLQARGKVTDQDIHTAMHGSVRRPQ